MRDWAAWDYAHEIDLGKYLFDSSKSKIVASFDLEEGFFGSSGGSDNTKTAPNKCTNNS